MIKSPQERRARFRKFRAQAILLGGAGLLLYLILADALAIFQVYQLDKEIVQLRYEIARLKEENQDYKNLIAYLKTDSFKEREARRKLNYRKPGEKVLVIPDQTALVTGPEGTSKTPPPLEERLKTLPLPYKWWYYLFEK